MKTVKNRRWQTALLLNCEDQTPCIRREGAVNAALAEEEAQSHEPVAPGSHLIRLKGFEFCRMFF